MYAMVLKPPKLQWGNVHKLALHQVTCLHADYDLIKFEPLTNPSCL